MQNGECRIAGSEARHSSFCILHSAFYHSALLAPPICLFSVAIAVAVVTVLLVVLIVPVAIAVAVLALVHIGEDGTDDLGAEAAHLLHRLPQRFAMRGA